MQQCAQDLCGAPSDNPTFTLTDDTLETVLDRLDLTAANEQFDSEIEAGLRAHFTSLYERNQEEFQLFNNYSNDPQDQIEPAQLDRYFDRFLFDNSILQIDQSISSTDPARIQFNLETHPLVTESMRQPFQQFAGELSRELLLSEHYRDKAISSQIFTYDESLNILRSLVSDVEAELESLREGAKTANISMLEYEIQNATTTIRAQEEYSSRDDYSFRTIADSYKRLTRGLREFKVNEGIELSDTAPFRCSDNSNCRQFMGNLLSKENIGRIYTQDNSLIQKSREEFVSEELEICRRKWQLDNFNMQIDENMRELEVSTRQALRSFMARYFSEESAREVDDAFDDHLQYHFSNELTETYTNEPESFLRTHSIVEYFSPINTGAIAPDAIFERHFYDGNQLVNTELDRALNCRTREDSIFQGAVQVGGDMAIYRPRRGSRAFQRLPHNHNHNILNVSMFSQIFPERGRNIIAHELGHFLMKVLDKRDHSNTFGNVDISRSTKNGFERTRQCLLTNYPENIENRERFLGEDFADEISFQIYPIEEDLFSCSLLVFRDREEYVGLSMHNPTSGVHSSGLFRVLREAKIKRASIPSSCRVLTDKFYSDFNFDRCEIQEFCPNDDERTSHIRRCRSSRSSRRNGGR